MLKAFFLRDYKYRLLGEMTDKSDLYWKHLCCHLYCRVFSVHLLFLSLQIPLGLLMYSLQKLYSKQNIKQRPERMSVSAMKRDKKPLLFAQEILQQWLSALNNVIQSQTCSRPTKFISLRKSQLSIFLFFTLKTSLIKKNFLI